MESDNREAHRQHHHTAYINIFCFIGCFVSGGIGSAFPLLSFWQNTWWEIANALFITACALTSVQLADRKWIIPAAGFIMLSISFIEFFTMVPLDTIDKAMEVGKCGMLFVPAMVMISYYKLFPMWVRAMGVISCLPFILIIFVVNYSGEKYLFDFMKTGYILIEVTSVIWGIYFLRNLRREQAK